MLVWLLLVGFAGALAFAVRLFIIQDRLIFQPVKPAPRTPASLGLDHEVLSLPLEGGGAVAGWWVPARAGDARGHLAVLYFHGSASHLSHELSTLRFLRSLGVATLLVEYPGYDEGTGRPDEGGCYQAAQAGWRHLLDVRGFEPPGVAVFGISLGAALATYLAERERPCGLVVHSAFTSVPDLAAHRYPWLPVRAFCRTRMDNLRRMPDCPAPLLVVHSEDDEHTPFRQAVRLYERHPGPKRLLPIHGPHFSNPWQRSRAVRSAWEQLLDGDTAAWERPG